MATFEKINKDTIRKTTTIVEDIDLRPLKEELAILNEEKEPSDEQLLAYARLIHPYYAIREQRIKELESQLNG